MILQQTHATISTSQLQPPQPLRGHRGGGVGVVEEDLVDLGVDDHLVVVAVQALPVLRAGVRPVECDGVHGRGEPVQAVLAALAVDGHVDARELPEGVIIVDQGRVEPRGVGRVDLIRGVAMAPVVLVPGDVVRFG